MAFKKNNIEMSMKTLNEWNRTTELCVDVKTILRSDCISQIGKDYPGVLKRDSEDHYTFIETIPSTNGKRNPHVFKGRYITVTRNDDGSLRPNFKPIRVKESFSVEQYAEGVSVEIIRSLEGLV